MRSSRVHQGPHQAAEALSEPNVPSVVPEPVTRTHRHDHPSPTSGATLPTAQPATATETSKRLRPERAEVKFPLGKISSEGKPFNKEVAVDQEPKIR